MRSWFLILALAMPAWSQPSVSPEQRAAALELVESAGLAPIVDTKLVALRAQMILSISHANPRIRAAQIEEIVDLYFVPEFRAHRSEAVEFTAEVWASRLSEQELRELTAFYRSPLGQRSLQLAIDVSVAANRLGMGWAARVASEVVAKHREALSAFGIDLERIAPYVIR